MGTLRVGEDAVRRIALLAHGATTDPSKWGEALGDMATAMRATGAALFTPQLDPEGRTLSAAFGSTADALEPYLGSWQPHDAWFQAITENHVFTTAGEVRTGSEVLAPKHLHRTPFYADFARQFELEELIALKICDERDVPAPSTQVTFFRPRGAELFAQSERRFLGELWPHLHLAVRTFWALRRLHEYEGVVEAALDSLPQPAWVLRADAGIEFANRAAQNLCRTAAWVRVHSGRLAAVGDVDQSALCGALGHARLNGGQVCASIVAEPAGMRRAVLRIAPLTPWSPFAAAWPLGRALLLLELPVPDDSQAAWVERLTQRFGLTVAEKRVLQGFIAGLTPSDLAERAGVSIHTVRTQLQAILQKTGCRRQVELMRLFGGK